ncbi:phage tail protein [Pasteurella atlantica]|uniref:Phage tail protein n=2 Tax=Pasteurellaceae TaxID=712 RepID=A0ACC6HJJ6_9PAST|nr:phage tail protein [Pasteurella atlantica]MDP8051050.1 phage tail protein [Pasteurella atlantica]MDP8104346.1 phage tail protein [Pasteurella atlantica]MDP8147706.1 phage tail protein [Pasteurella atlantica]
MSLEADTKKVIKNLEEEGKRYRKASNKAINKVARKAMQASVREVAKQVGVKQKTIRGRVRFVKKAKLSSPKAVVKVNRSDMPMIRVLETAKNELKVQKGAISVGKYTVARGFKKKLPNGRTHIIQRQGAERYPIDVVKIPLSQPFTDEFKKQLSDYPQQLKNEIRQIITAKK